MKLFEKAKKKKESARQPQAPAQPEIAPAPNTGATVFFDRADIKREEIENCLTEQFGAGAVLSVDDSSPSAMHFMLRIDSVSVMCSYMPFPYPQEECDIQALLPFSPYLTEEEEKAVVGHRSFCLLAQIGGGKTLAGKRAVCLALTKLCGGLLKIPGAAGVYYGAANLLLGGQMYGRYAAITGREGSDPAYFPSPLWVLVYRTRAGDGEPAVETCGLAQFGFPELQFYKPEEAWADSCEKLYSMAALQITEKEHYRNMDTISFAKDSFSVFKQDGEKLAVIGGI